MSAGTLHLNANNQGLRPVDLRRDLSGIASLMELCFGDMLDHTGRYAVREMEFLSRTGPLLWLLGSVAPNWRLGFVWVENGNVVGNVSTQVSEFDRRTWLAANVAVHPDHRRRGIAAALTEAAIRLAAENGATCVLLQVHQHNTGALDLYRALGFHVVTTRTTWERSSRVETQGIPLPGVEVRPARRDEWEAEFELVKELRPAGFNWLRPLRKTDWRPSFWRSLANFFTGNSVSHWLAVDESAGKLAGAFIIETGFGVVDQVALVVRPEWCGRLERPLLATALRRLAHRPWTVRIDHPASDEPAEAALKEFGFRSTQTLVWMRKDLS
ncbi:MAG TPA: GNAT family N-acetyltransferase [Anaerolineales bacterium]|nr:GNAT family N-acetyltransferase [Anaerolineales bacterium]